MTIESPKFKKEGKEPIVDIELNEATLETWERQGLRGDIIFSLENFKALTQPNGPLSLHPLNFETAEDFIKSAGNMFVRFKAKNFREKMKEVENEAKKAVLNFAFKELEFDPKNPEIIREQRIKQNDRELIIQYFKINQPNLVLGFDTIDWWIERR
jgi:hypothetical protein